MYLGLNEFCESYIKDGKIIVENKCTEAYLEISSNLAVILCIISNNHTYSKIINDIQQLSSNDKNHAMQLLNVAIQRLEGFVDISNEILPYGELKYTIKDVLKINSSIKIAIHNELPTQVHLMMTNSCNHSCIYCEKEATYVKEIISHEKDDFLLLSDVELLLDNYCKFDKNVKFVITGGEPTLNPNIVDIINLLNQHNFEIMLVTKGITNLNKFEQICKSGINNIIFSLDSCNEYEEDLIAGSGTFKEIISCINVSKKHDINITINTVLMKSNYKNINEMVDFCIINNISKLHFVVVRPLGRCQKKLALDKNEMKYCFEEVKKLRKKYGAKIDILFTCDYSNCNIDICKNCGNRNKVINLHKNGIVTSCGQVSYIGSLKENNLKNIWVNYINSAKDNKL